MGDTGIEPVTSSVSRKRSPTELIARGGGGNRTRVQGFAGPCLSHSATPPSPGGSGRSEPTGGPTGPEVLRADDGIRTRDPHLGKVMRYQLRYVRMCSVSAAWWRTLAQPCRASKPAPRPRGGPRLHSVVRGLVQQLGERDVEVEPRVLGARRGRPRRCGAGSRRGSVAQVVKTACPDGEESSSCTRFGVRRASAAPARRLCRPGRSARRAAGRGRRPSRPRVPFPVRNDACTA